MENNESLPPELQWPKWQWYRELFLSLIGVLIDFVTFVFPSLAQGRFERERVIILLVLLLLPFLVPMLIWLWRAGCVVRRRVRYYPLLHARTELAMNDLTQMKKGFFDFVYSLNTGYAFDIKKATYYREKLYIVLGRTERHNLSEGDILTVIHKDDQLTMGFFKVTEVRDEEYYAMGVHSIDPVWSGFVRQQGEVEVMPYLTAIYLPQGEAK